MKKNLFDKIVEKFVKERGYQEYEINSIKLTDTNFSVDEEGELTHEKHIEVNIIPKKACEKININFTIKRDDNEWN